MREIKFRAWVPDLGRMSPTATLDHIKQSIHLNGYDKAFEDTLIYMQYTGLKDKNGVEIYEGDIVNIHGVISLSQKYTGEIRWREDRWHVWQGDEWYDNGDYYYGDEVNWTHIEVIGNIYENPELLK